MLPSLSCGIVAALTGQAIAFPAEVVSRRMATGAVAGNTTAGGLHLSIFQVRPQCRGD